MLSSFFPSPLLLFASSSLIIIQLTRINSYDSDLIDQYHAAQTVVWDMDDAQEIQLHVCDLFFEELFLACGTEVCPTLPLFSHLLLMFLFPHNKLNRCRVKQCFNSQICSRIHWRRQTTPFSNSASSRPSKRLLIRRTTVLPNWLPRTARDSTTTKVCG